LTWPEIASRLSAPRIYWLHTTSPSGAPQATPVWGVVVHDSLYFYTERSTVKARNLARDQRVLVHLESGADVVIVHGRLVDLGRPADTPGVVDAFDAKYDEAWEKPFLPANQPAFDVLYVLEPARAALWTLPDSTASMRRWAGGGPARG
jgi:hypothetical protein